MKTIFMMLALLTAVQASAQTETLKVWMDDVTLTADGQTVTRLYLMENDVVDYTAFSLSLIVPKGVTIAKVKSGRNTVNDIRLTERLNDHTISCNMLSDGRTIKIISSSPSNSNFYPDDVDGNVMDSIFSIGLVPDPAMVNGNYTIEIKDCKFVLQDATASQPQEAVTASMKVTGGVDGLTINYEISEVGVGTLILPFDASLPQGLDAFVCSSLDGDLLILTEQESIKANTPLIVTGLPGTYTFVGASVASEKCYSDGVLTGVMEQTQVNEGYVLQNLNGVTGFYRVNPDKSVEVPAYRCYMNNVAEADCVRIMFGNETGIGELNATSVSKGKAFDLQGRRVKKNAARGVYILNGEKVVVK